MRLTPEKTARWVMIAGFTLFVGTLLVHAWFMYAVNRVGPHPEWLDWPLLAGLGMMGLGTLAALITRGEFLILAIILVMVAVLAAIVFPTVC